MPVPADLPALTPAFFARRGPGAWSARALLALACSAASVGAQDAWLLAADGRSGSGLLSLADGELHVGTLACALPQLIDCQLAPAAATQIDAGVVLVDGSILRGVPERVEGEHLTIRTDLFGAERLPTSAIAALILTPTPVSACTEGLGGEGVRFPNGEGVDGPLAYVNMLEIGVTVGRRIRRFPRERIARVRFHALAPTPGITLALRAGDVLHGSLRSLSDERVVLTTLLGTRELPLAAISACWSADPGLEPLEHLPLTEQDQPAVEAIHPAQAAPLPPSALWPAGLDRGLRLDAGATLTTTAIAGWQALVGTVACAHTGAPVACTVLVDGRQAWSSGLLAPGTSPQVVHVTLGGAHTLSLHVTGDASGAPGTAIWITPTLVR